MKNLFLLFFCLNCFGAWAQPTGPVNQRDGHGKKTGYWKSYFNDQLYQTDSANASYFGYDYYMNGKMVIHCIGTYIRKKNFVRLEHEGQQPVKGHPLALDGNFKTYDTSGLSEEVLYQNGNCLKGMIYFPDSKVVFELSDYTQHYQGNPYSFRHQLRYEDGTIRSDDWEVPDEKGNLVTVKIQ